MHLTGEGGARRADRQPGHCPTSELARHRTRSESAPGLILARVWIWTLSKVGGGCAEVPPCAPSYYVFGVLVVWWCVSVAYLFVAVHIYAVLVVGVGGGGGVCVFVVLFVLRCVGGWGCCGCPRLTVHGSSDRWRLVWWVVGATACSEVGIAGAVLCCGWWESAGGCCSFSLSVVVSAADSFLLGLVGVSASNRLRFVVVVAALSVAVCGGVGFCVWVGSALGDPPSVSPDHA